MPIRAEIVAVRAHSASSAALRPVNCWEHEEMQDRLDRMPDAMGVRRQTVEHPFGTPKAWIGATYFLNRTLNKVSELRRASTSWPII
jgi:hypothetical protein